MADIRSIWRRSMAALFPPPPVAAMGTMHGEPFILRRTKNWRRWWLTHRWDGRTGTTEIGLALAMRYLKNSEREKQRRRRLIRSGT